MYDSVNILSLHALNDVIYVHISDINHYGNRQNQTLELIV